MHAFRPNHPRPTGSDGATLEQVIGKVERGYDFASFLALAKRLGVAQAHLAEVLGISASTLQRRREGAFSAAEFGRIYQLEALAALVERVIGDAHDAKRWLNTPNRNLGAVPLDLARTAPGLEAVNRYLLLNPAHPSFSDLELTPPERFSFDERLARLIRAPDRT